MSKDVLRRSKRVCLTKSWKESGLEKLEEGAIEQELIPKVHNAIKVGGLTTARFTDRCFKLKELLSLVRP